MSFTNATYNATYNATGPAKSSAKVAPYLRNERLHQMIVWIMLHQEDAMRLLPEYQKIRQQVTERNEAQNTYQGHDR
jgi:hypothetical protein